tara:strand:+ start:1954 stop:2151 length:198 start_codon:yes stop_codon:yes gene_type:complete
MAKRSVPRRVSRRFADYLDESKEDFGKRLGLDNVSDSDITGVLADYLRKQKGKKKKGDNNGYFDL